MSEIASCPYCGAPGRPAAAVAGGRMDPGLGPLGPLYTEIRRIREIAEARGAGQSRGAAPAGEAGRGAGMGGPGQAGGGDENLCRIADLTREVHELRATVARLRGSTGAGIDGSRGLAGRAERARAERARAERARAERAGLSEPG